MKVSYIFLFIPILFFGCFSDDTEIPDTGYRYYPLTSGQYWIYEIDEIQYSIDGNMTTSSYSLKITIQDSVSSNQEINYSIKVEKRQKADDPWAHIESWSSYKDDYKIVLTKGSLPVIKFTFPVLSGNSWNANALNAMPENEVYYDSLGRSFSVSQEEYSNTVTVVISNEDDLLNISSDDIEYEVYAPDVGLIYSKSIDLSYKSCSSQFSECCEGGVNNCFDEIYEGSIIEKKLIEFGN